MVALPHGIQYVTSLKELSIWYCESLTTIPEWIIDLKSLKKLEVWNCPGLTSLPEGIQRLTSLKRLEIRECPILLQGCRRQTGQVWSKIAHIPDLSLHPDPNADH
ncbi:LRR domain containing protein [Trema orientale]|uniref:LRR domain containing protein n=1 Tax=Trema orientale TaxID=63057 RepID=A0A2P5FFI2_TREOI|nr:LRR domain containing protein [Trema orientale]